MTFHVVFDTCQTPLPDVDAVEAFLAERPYRYATHGGRAMSYWFASGDGEAVLRADIDYDTGRAALRWLPDRMHAVELEPTVPIVVMASSDLPPVSVPAALARVSIDAAHRAIVEYVSTGQRPTNVQWMAD